MVGLSEFLWITGTAGTTSWHALSLFFMALSVPGSGEILGSTSGTIDNSLGSILRKVKEGGEGVVELNAEKACDAA